jgi:hypothetical protein
MAETKEISIRDIQGKIVRLPGHPPAMLASDLAAIYETKTEAINQAVKRNPERFPEDFCFKLTKTEWKNLRSQNVMSSWGGARVAPWAFTREGSNMLSAVLTSKVAVERSVQIMRAYSAFEAAIREPEDTNELLNWNIVSSLKLWARFVETHNLTEIPTTHEMVSKDEIIDLQRCKIELLEMKMKKQAPPPKRRSTPMSGIEKMQIIDLHVGGLSPNAIARKVGRHRTTVQRFLSASPETKGVTHA